MENNNIDENNNNDNNGDSMKETINSSSSEPSPNTIQSLMMYGNNGGESLFVSQPSPSSSSLTDSLMAQFEENSRLTNLKRMGYVSSIAHTNHYVTINNDDDENMDYGRRRYKRAH
ncbi:hypothetical protein DERF_015015 [Dermatophagoides farinae]|uniref:Uncharacterized protein n=1 Tax=Dermatophagoides farinae TaxID=6954 RepID=A0A922L1T7_DERFA|nr:hypothetical protein DERF_015015 [Dermatophagoides farinae]